MPPLLPSGKLFVERTSIRTRAWRSRWGCTGAGSPASPCCDGRIASTWMPARVDASLTSFQACTREMACLLPS
ncbi:MAG: hypothetical protein ACR2JY_03965, partial [Chloroflexota bacterium]